MQAVCVKTRPLPDNTHFRRLCSVRIRINTASKSFHLGYVLSEIEYDLNRQFCNMLIIVVVNILLNLKAVIYNGLSALSEGLLHK